MRNEKAKKRISTINLILSVLISFAAWMYVVYSVHPTINKSFRDIPISFEGQYNLAEYGYAIESAEKTNIDITLKINRTDISKISDSDIHIVADVSNAAQGDNNIELQITVPSGTSIKSQEAGIITVNVQPVTCKDVELIVDYKADATDSVNEEETSEPVLDSASYEEVSVYGTYNNLRKVKYAEAFIDKSGVGTSSKQLTVNPIAIDKSGNTVDYITVFPSEVEVEVHDASTKKVSLNVNIKDEATDKLKRTYKVPSSVYIKGAAKTINSITSIQSEEININGISKYTELPIKYNLPEGVYISNKSADQKIKVSIESDK